MTGRTHQLFGLVLSVGTIAWVIEPTYSPASLAAMLLATHFGALVPDIDSAAADIWEHLPFGRMAGEAADMVLAHRKFTHSLASLGLFGVLVWYLSSLMPAYWGISSSLLLLGFIIGYGSHLFADMLTVQGVPLLWPWRVSLGIPPKPFEGVRIISGGWFEQLVFFPILNAVLALTVWLAWPTLAHWLFKVQ